jgi:1-acyl-sn-glycerol-3-phosphate acyltransferase
MTPGRSRPKKPRARSRTTRRPSRQARPALGNDPFARGAAPRPPASPRPEPEPPPAPERPASPPPPRPAANGAADLVQAAEHHVTTALDGIEERLVDLAERAGLREAGRELQQALGSLLPRLRAGLGSAMDLLRLLEPPERLDRFGMDPRFAERFAPIAELLYRAWWRTSVRDAARVPSTGPAIVVANHAGLVPWDALVLRLALRLDHPARRELRPLLDERECTLPLVGPVAVRLGAVRASPDAAEAVLAQGQLVGVFPEGSAGARKPWRERYRLQRFGRGGFVKLALRTRAPIIPCAIVGSEEASPGISRAGWLAERLGVPLIGKGAALRFGPAALLPLPSRWSLRFGPAVDVRDHPPALAADPATVNALTERVRSTLQAMLDEDLAARGSVFL